MDEKKLFAARLREICTDMGLPDRGRQSALAAAFKVTPNAARKWLLGLGFPEPEVAITIAKWADVNFEWLMTGRGPKSGEHLPTRALIVDEVLRRGTSDERREVVNFLRYKLEHSEVPLAAEERARYEAALLTYVDAPTRRQ
jgi:transcriptional regulator with XRE-family HTH domain